MAEIVENFTVPGNFIWVAPAGVSEVKVEVYAGGGGGNGGAVGNGGGGAAYSRTDAYPVIAGNSYDYQLGAGGGENGNGVDSWFDTNTSVKAEGGFASGNGRDGGFASNGFGDIKFSGGQGGLFGPGVGGAGGGCAGTSGNGGNAVGVVTGNPGSGGSLAGGGGNGGPGNGSPGNIVGGGGGGAPPFFSGAAGARGHMVLTYTPVLGKRVGCGCS